MLAFEFRNHLMNRRRNAFRFPKWYLNSLSIPLEIKSLCNFSSLLTTWTAMVNRERECRQVGKSAWSFSEAFNFTASSDGILKYAGEIPYGHRLWVSFQISLQWQFWNSHIIPILNNRSENNQPRNINWTTDELYKKMKPHCARIIFWHQTTCIW